MKGFMWIPVEMPLHRLGKTKEDERLYVDI
jgi:hypothetical protein